MSRALKPNEEGRRKILAKTTHRQVRSLGLQAGRRQEKLGRRKSVNCDAGFAQNLSRRAQYAQRRLNIAPASLAAVFTPRDWLAMSVPRRGSAQEPVEEDSDAQIGATLFRRPPLFLPPSSRRGTAEGVPRRPKSAEPVTTGSICAKLAQYSPGHCAALITPRDVRVPRCEKCAEPVATGSKCAHQAQHCAGCHPLPAACLLSHRGIGPRCDSAQNLSRQVLNAHNRWKFPPAAAALFEPPYYTEGLLRASFGVQKAQNLFKQVQHAQNRQKVVPAASGTTLPPSHRGTPRRGKAQNGCESPGIAQIGGM
ncbi:hypothetical protein V495_06108 [Pseudogymnoascus sp. VKM F-4514 (FW-929)]|nr:hypothetical protein V495_06108 [Pseudogymnoascus sp. VKM F-4514 (FW-929)]KFY61527.1 hypothetical protein V497_02901 [Pseudogymnoascus sp. VKM F-4516 (FW-969)]